MSSVVRGVRAFVMFWVEFIIGDDWTVAVTVALVQRRIKSFGGSF